MTPFLGQIQLFGFTFPPQGWAQCNGQLLLINQNSALFALLGTIYGGDGVTTFGLPDLRGRVPVHYGQGPGLSPYTIGQGSGSESRVLTQSNLPSHSHALRVSSGPATSQTPNANLLAETAEDTYATADDVAMAASAIGTTGSSQSFDIRQPYRAVNYCIALQGVFPSQ